MALMLSPSAAIKLTHAAVQVIADDTGADVLHIKGPALDPRLRWTADAGDPPSASPRSSTDADVWVRPQHLEGLRKALQREGWSVAYHFEDGSPFGHAMTLMHDTFAPLDLHRRFPGISVQADQAFNVLWERRIQSEIGGVTCIVPDLVAQRLILLLHAVRARRQWDIAAAYERASAAEQSQVWALARQLEAEVALAAATGVLDDFRDRREYALWRAIMEGEPSRARMWIARVRAESTLRDRVRTGIALVAPKSDRLQASLGRRPTSRDRARELARTARTGVREMVRLAATRQRR